jgi:hypothetical protein
MAYAKEPKELIDSGFPVSYTYYIFTSPFPK